jgi:hypothetical protein
VKVKSRTVKDWAKAMDLKHFSRDKRVESLELWGKQRL